MSGIRIGTVTHYFDRIGVAVLDLTDNLKVGETVHFLGHSCDFAQKIDSMQIEHKSVTEAGPGQEVAVKVLQPVRQHTSVFRIEEE